MKQHNIKAETSEVIQHLDDISLIDMVASQGAAIENNVRWLIIDITPVSAKFYERMSEFLTELVKKRKYGAISRHAGV